MFTQFKNNNNNQATSLIEESFADFKDMVEDMSEGNEKKQKNKNVEYC